ncbi:hypothetical protein DPMN_034358 [Dreissena polymorpha]|uniref:Uncharacterized protein n=1 Tax=Dreissena polymorpha TaxID=45954 RepID=A0A9D4M8H2_DREPO|nr:hypothetical protein DPMN_034358 [Dreissena polymorpha]
MREVPGLGSLLKNGGVFLQCGALERGLEVTVGVASLLQRNCQLCHVSLHRLDPEDEVEVSRCVADGISSGVVTQPQEPRIYPSEQAVRAIGHKEKHPQENVVLKVGTNVVSPF